MLNNIIKAIVSLILCMVTAAYAGQIQWLHYKADKVVPITATAFSTTQIVFADDEIIKNIQNGDLDAWTVSVQKNLSNMLFLKPTVLGSDTNMTVVTNRHSYYFHLISKKSGPSTVTTYAIHFIYPHSYVSQKLDGQSNAVAMANTKNWDYSYSGDHQLLPRRVYDDGKFTYLQLRPHQQTPAIFAVTNRQGNEAVVNFRRRGTMLIVQRVAPQWSLRLGKYHVLSLFNNHYFKRRG
ncbi:MAG: TrbG/VirB9 family P-type conjugative transfer protein [Coxiellaceae bacterium]|nr:TrbG/VirB9 family P-type conjugative transfer protein [Coxiellaceae bacterium]